MIKALVCGLFIAMVVILVIYGFTDEDDGDTWYQR